MKKLFNIALISLPLLAAAGTGLASAATGLPQYAAIHGDKPSLIHHVGYFLPDGVYVPTCGPVFVGYNAFGQPIFETVCQ